MTNKFLKAALYARVSSEMQIDNFSIMAQLTELQHYCKLHDIIIHDKYIDEGVSGSKEDRKGLQKLLKDSDNFDIVLVHKYDRFARKVELSAKIKRILRESNVKVISITEPIEDSPIGFFQEGLLELLSEYYIKNLSREVKKGHIERARQGFYNGSLPYGYYSKDGKLYIKKDEAKIIKLIYDMYLQGQGCTKIAMWLQEHNIITQKGNLFQYFQVNKILKNIKYTGQIGYDGEVYEGQHEAIIDKETFDKVQEELTKRNVNPQKGRKGRRTFNYYLYYLLDVLYCGECGTNMRIAHSSPNQKFYASYTCGSSYRRSGKCDFTKHFNAKKFEPELENLLRKYANSKIDLLFDVAEKKDENNINTVLQERLLKIDNELLRNKKAYLAEVFELDEYREIKTKLENEKMQIENELKLPKQIKNKKDIEKNFRKTLKDNWDLFEDEKDICKKRTILKKIINRVYLYKDGGIKIEFN
jgi:site-specific DNA recombinase